MVEVALEVAYAGDMAAFLEVGEPREVSPRRGGGVEGGGGGGGVIEVKDSWVRENSGGKGWR